jgi:hypothetical protein
MSEYGTTAFSAMPPVHGCESSTPLPSGAQLLHVGVAPLVRAWRLGHSPQSPSLRSVKGGERVGSSLAGRPVLTLSLLGRRPFARAAVSVVCPSRSVSDVGGTARRSRARVAVSVSELVVHFRWELPPSSEPGGSATLPNTALRAARGRNIRFEPGGPACCLCPSRSVSDVGGTARRSRARGAVSVSELVDHFRWELPPSSEPGGSATPPNTALRAARGRNIRFEPGGSATLPRFPRSARSREEQWLWTTSGGMLDGPAARRWCPRFGRTRW